MARARRHPRRPGPRHGGRRRRGLPVVADPALARSRASARHQRRRQPARVRGRRPGRRPRAAVLVVGRRLLARPEGPRGRRELADGRHRDLVLLAPQGRGRAHPRPLRGRARRDARRAHAAGAGLQARGGLGDPPPVRGSVPAEPAGAPPADPRRAEVRPAALPGRALARRRRGVPARRARAGARRVQPGGRPGARRRRARPPARRAPQPRAPRTAARRRGRHLAPAAPAVSAGLGRHGARRADHEHRPRSDELGWTPRHSSRDALLELLAGLRDGAGADTPRLAPRAGGRFRAGEVRSGVGAREG